jgi:Protein of unknown function (DUF3987)
MQEIPSEILTPGGLVGEIAEFIYANSYVPNRIVAYCGAICALSYVMGARYRTPDDVYPGLYTVLVGKTGSGKDSAFRMVKRIIKQLVFLHSEKDMSMLRLRRGVTQKISTRQGIEDKLCDMDERPDLFIEMDEIGRFLQGTDRNEQSKSFCSLLVEQYNSDALHLRNLSDGANKKARPTVIDYPSMTVLGASNMTSIANGVGYELVEDGFINRFMWFDIDSMREDIRDSHRIADPPESLLNKLAKIGRIKGIGSNQRRVLEYEPVVYAAGAEKVFGDYDRQIREDEEAQDRDLAFKTRVALQAKKLATVYAVAKSKKQPVITVGMAEAAVRVADWCATRTIEVISQNVTDDRVYKIIKDIKAYLDRTINSDVGCNLITLVNVPTYHKAKGIIKHEIRTEFFEQYGSEYGSLVLGAKRAGRKTTVIYKLSKGSRCKMTRFLTINPNLPEGKKKVMHLLSSEQLQQIAEMNG